MEKGEHEKSMERARKMLLDGEGMGEILDKTHLREKDIKKLQRKINDKL
ncbi:MAG: hypothetical protein ACERKV_05900 [Clostridiaceae bacterium]